MESQPFVDVGHLRVRAGWSSLFRLAPVVKEVTVTTPAIHVVRTGEQRFNFSDLLEAPNPPPPPPKETAPGKPLRFAVSNIRLIDGDIHFDDQVLNQQHRIEKIQLGVPFIANLPADVDIYVQPLLQMIIDGSPLRIVGRAKPFANPPESVVDLRLHRLELQRYLAYAPKQIAIKVPQGTLSTDVQVHFVNAATEGARPHISLSGPIAIDDLAVHDAADAPLVDLQHAVIKLGDVEPLDNLIALHEIWIDGLVVHPTLNADGSNNFASVMGPAPVASATPAAAATPAAPLTQSAATPTPTTAPTTAMEVSLDSFEMVNSAVKLADHRNATPNNVSLDDIHVTMHNFHLAGGADACALRDEREARQRRHYRGEGWRRFGAIAGHQRSGAGTNRSAGAARICASDLCGKYRERETRRPREARSRTSATRRSTCTSSRPISRSTA